MSPASPKALLLDIGGTLHVDRVWLPGVLEALGSLRDAGVALRYVTNMTQFNRGDILEFFTASGLKIEPGHVFTAATCAAEYLARAGRPRVLALCRPALAAELAESCELVSSGPVDHVLVADMGDLLNKGSLDAAFQALMGGAELLGMERNRFYRLGDGLHLDSGPILSALEVASGKTASMVFGKPNPRLFELALASAGARADEAWMIGDDLEADVLAPRRLGMSTALVRTGKSQKLWEERCLSEGIPVLDSVAALPGFFGLGLA